jgi:hypothetical protein
MVEILQKYNDCLCPECLKEYEEKWETMNNEQ